MVPVTGPDMDRISSRLGIRFEVPVTTYSSSDDGWTYAGKRPPTPLLESMRRLTVNEIARYPRPLVKLAGLKRVVILRGITLDGASRGTTYSTEQGTLYVDVDDLYTGGQEYMRQVIHHETFHMLDTFAGTVEADPVWNALNRKGFKYGKGGESMQDDPSAGVYTLKYPGFLNRYSTSGQEEDKAEVFSTAITVPGYMLQRSRKDPVLAKKLRLMDQRLKQWGAVPKGWPQLKG